MSREEDQRAAGDYRHPTRIAAFLVDHGGERQEVTITSLSGEGLAFSGSMVGTGEVHDLLVPGAGGLEIYRVEIRWSQGDHAGGRFLPLGGRS